MKYIKNQIFICLINTVLFLGIALISNFSLAQEEGGVNISNQQALDFFLIETSIKEDLPLEVLRSAFEDVKPQNTAKQYMVPSGGASRKNWVSYSANVMSPSRLQAGKKFLADHHTFLDQLEQRTGVPKSVVLGIIGVETVYGRNMGNFSVRDVLTTFAFDYPATPNRAARAEMFRNQLHDHLLNCIPNKQTLEVQALKACLNQEGSFAGAIGMPQFMPSSIRQFAKDGDGDGKIDLRSSPEDAMESVTHFLLAHGWQKGEPIRLPIPDNQQRSDYLKSLADGDPNPKYTLGDLKLKGIIQNIPSPLNNQSPALIVDLPSVNKDGSDAVNYLVGLKNFEVITQYNRSFFYALSVTEFGEAVVGGDTMMSKQTSKKSSKQGKHPSTNSGRHGHRQ
jgi:membrane-bound lytic murein transglycosylase B